MVLLRLLLILKSFIREVFIVAILLVVITLGLKSFVPSYYQRVENGIKNGLGVRLGLVDQQVKVSGTGSMYPTFPKGTGKTIEEQSEEVVATPGMQLYPTGFTILGKSFFDYQIKRGDIVSFSNQKVFEITRELNGVEAGFIKRIVGLPGDIIEIRDGIVNLNKIPLKEPYTAKPHSTFGSEGFPECREFKIPEGKLFVMGDNRKASSDSRHSLGVIDYQDIDHVIPIEKQKGVLDKNWRDTKDDLDSRSKIKIVKDKLLELINLERKKVGAKNLRYETKLFESTTLRGKAILRSNDFSPEATKSGYTFTKAMNEVGYSNIITGEIPVQGYFEASELVQNLLEFPEVKKFLLDGRYQDIGISEVEGDLTGCPTQVIVIHLGGYVPPNYKKEEIESWKKSLDRINEVLPTWERIEGDNRFNQDEVKELLGLLKDLKSNYERIYKRMESNEWLKDEDREYIDRLEGINKRIKELQDKLNG